MDSGDNLSINLVKTFKSTHSFIIIDSSRVVAEEDLLASIPHATCLSHHDNPGIYKAVRALDFSIGRFIFQVTRRSASVMTRQLSRED